MSWQTTNSF